MNTLRVVSVVLGLAAAVLVLSGCASRDAPLQLLSGAGAIYPPDARAAGVEGYVVVRYDVGPDGRVAEPRVVRAEPRGVFEESALQAVSRWRFSEPKRDGAPTTVQGVESRLDFRLSGGEAYQNY
jgi:TonB family protein